MTFPVVTLLTDFGLRDHFAGVLKGCVLSVCPSAQVADISHEVAAFDILEGAFLLAQSWRYFPVGTVHVVVVDPGVGSSRRPIVAEAGGHLFVAPDNGVLTTLYAEEDPVVRHVTEDRFFHHPVSQTFHGRDIFAPVAGHLAARVAPAELGPVIDDFVRLQIPRPVPQEGGAWTGTILKVDRYGNLITNLRATDFVSNFVVTLSGLTIGTLSKNYAAGLPGKPFLIAGSSGYWEIAVSQSSAARLLNVGVGAILTLQFGNPFQNVR